MPCSGCYALGSATINLPCCLQHGHYIYMIGTPGPQSVFAVFVVMVDNFSFYILFIASAVADFSHNIILREEVCSVRIVISITNVLQMFSQNNSLKIVCTDSLSTIIKICKYAATGSSQRIKSIIS